MKQQSYSLVSVLLLLAFSQLQVSANVFVKRCGGGAGGAGGGQAGQSGNGCQQLPNTPSPQVDFNQASLDNNQDNEYNEYIKFNKYDQAIRKFLGSDYDNFMNYIIMYINNNNPNFANPQLLFNCGEPGEGPNGGEGGGDC
jgi:hypothetical protein